MKNLGAILVLVLTTLLISCQKEEPHSQPETGMLHIDIGLSIRVNEVSNVLKSVQQTEDFKVLIYKSGGTLVMAFESVQAMPDTIELQIGDYYVEAHSDNNLPAAFENPYYYGISEEFSLNSNMVNSVQVNCMLANTMVSVEYSENVKSSFTDYTTTVSTSLGSLEFSSVETRMGYFQPAPMEIAVALYFQNPDGSQGIKTLSGNIPEPLANRHYEILVNATLDDGQATFLVLLDDAPVPVEVVEISGGSSSPTGAVGYGELLITEIMYDPSALSDTEGEYLEIYNNSARTINLQNLVLARDDIYSHVITESIELPPAAYYVFQRSDLATGAGNSYVYGSDISLSNTGAVVALYNEGAENNPGALIISIDYGEASFPSGTGASIILNPALTHTSDAISGTSWCVSTSVYQTGDSGTPGAVNDICQ
jgi:hypothetical protein